jgi:hypothetical protein
MLYQRVIARQIFLHKFEIDKNRKFFFLANAKAVQKIRLGIIWNRINILKEEPKNNELEILPEIDLYSLLELALLENKYEFVNFLLENEIINLVKFLDIERLKRLYNYGTVFDLFLFNSVLSDLFFVFI